MKMILDLDAPNAELERYSAYMSRQPLVGDLSLTDVELANDKYGQWLSAQRRKQDKTDDSLYTKALALNVCAVCLMYAIIVFFAYMFICLLFDYPYIWA